MKKENLKPGYYVKLRDESYGLISYYESRVLPDSYDYRDKLCIDLENDYCWLNLDNYNENLKHISFYDLDIVEVYGYSSYPYETREKTGRRTLWKRSKTEINSCRELIDYLKQQNKQGKIDVDLNNFIIAKTSELPNKQDIQNKEKE